MTDLTVAVDGHLEPSTLPIEAALTRLWETVRALPIGEYQLGAMERLLGSGSASDMDRLLDGEGVVDFPLDLTGGGKVIVRVQRGDGLTASQRIAARYSPQQQPGPCRGSSLWTIRDAETGDFVRDEGEIIKFAIRESAQGWISRRANLAGYRSTRRSVGAE